MNNETVPQPSASLILEFGSAILQQLPRDMTSEQMKYWIGDKSRLKNLLEELCTTKFVSNPFFRCISGGEKIIIDACDGKKNFTEADISHIVPDLQDWIQKHQATDQATESTPVSVNVVKKKTSLFNIFSGFGYEADKVSLTPHQICVFIKKYKSWMSKTGCVTHFLVKKEEELAVISMEYHFECGLEAIKHDLSREVCSTSQIVVPKLS